MKRIALFLLTNLGVMLVLGLVVNVLGLNRFLSANGLSVMGPLGFALVMGFGGAFISLLISKPIAKWTAGVRLINDSPDPTHRWLVSTVERFARQAGVRMPEVGVYEGSPNTFATGAFKTSDGHQRPIEWIDRLAVEPPADSAAHRKTEAGGVNMPVRPNVTAW